MDYNLYCKEYYQPNYLQRFTKYIFIILIWQYTHYIITYNIYYTFQLKEPVLLRLKDPPQLHTQPFVEQI